MKKPVAFMCIWCVPNFSNIRLKFKSNKKISKIWKNISSLVIRKPSRFPKLKKYWILNVKEFWSALKSICSFKQDSQDAFYQDPYHCKGKVRLSVVFRWGKTFCSNERLAVLHCLAEGIENYAYLKKSSFWKYEPENI